MRARKQNTNYIYAKINQLPKLQGYKWLLRFIERLKVLIIYLFMYTRRLFHIAIDLQIFWSRTYNASNT